MLQDRVHIGVEVFGEEVGERVGAQHGYTLTSACATMLQDCVWAGS